jgi:TRAP-type C4-dicarboxylate transport system permease small subunit
VSRAVSALTGAIDRFITVLAGIAGAAVLVMLVVTVGNIALRLVGEPYNGTFEVVGMLSVVVNGLALAEAQRHKAHIAIDLLVGKAPVRAQLVIGAVITVVSGVMFFLLAQNLVGYGLNLRDAGSVTESLRLPYWPLALVLALGVCGLVLALLNDLVQIGRNLRSDVPEGIW